MIQIFILDTIGIIFLIFQDQKTALEDKRRVLKQMAIIKRMAPSDLAVAACIIIMYMIIADHLGGNEHSYYT